MTSLTPSWMLTPLHLEVPIMASKFFFVCAGMLMLALSYHFGASTAGAQVGGSQIVGLEDETCHEQLLAISRDGELYRLERGSNVWSSSVNVLAEAGVGGEVVDIVARNTSDQPGLYVVTSAGDLCFQPRCGGPWVARGNVFGGPVPTLHESWGQVKARYHATPGMTVTPGADNR
jgi:hypothetical protein